MPLFLQELTDLTLNQVPEWQWLTCPACDGVTTVSAEEAEWIRAEMGRALDVDDDDGGDPEAVTF